MKKTVKLLLCLTTCFMMIFTFAACGNSNSYSKDYSSFDSDDYYSGSDYYYDDYEEVAEEDLSFSGHGDTGSDASDFVVESNDKLVYTCSIEMETLSFENSVNAMHELIRKYDGFVETENQTDNSNDWYYTTYEKTTGTLKEYITIRIPTKNYDAFIAEMEGNGKVTSKNQSVENITREYYDVQTTITSLRTQEQRLLEMMEDCETIDEMIIVEDRLSEVQNELSIYQSRLNTMDADVAYSTIHITITEVVKYDPVVKTDTFGDRLVNTLTDSAAVFLSFLEGLLFFLIYAIPIGSVIGVIAFGIVCLVRAIVKAARKRNKKLAAKAAEKDAKEAEKKKMVAAAPARPAQTVNPTAPARPAQTVNPTQPANPTDKQ